MTRRWPARRCTRSTPRDYAEALAIAIVLIALILILMGGLSLLQHRGDGLRLRFRAAT